MQSIYSITKKKLEEYFTNKGDKKFRATQIFEWVYRKGVSSFDEMSNISKDVIEDLKTAAAPAAPSAKSLSVPGKAQPPAPATQPDLGSADRPPPPGAAPPTPPCKNR